MKVLRVINSIDPHSGGPIEGLKLASTVMLDAGVEVEVACLNEEAAVKEEIEAMDWPVHALGPSSLGSYSYSSTFKVWLNENLGRFDAVIIHGCWQYHGLATALACQRMDRPYYVYPHGMLDPWFNETYPLKKIKKTLYWRWGEHRVLSGARSVLFTCEEERRLARNSFKPYQVQEHVIGYGTTVPKLPEGARTSYRRPIEGPYFLFLGRIQEK
ncbi:MAG: glycosyltransferase, partial [Verrucomicrobiota bacterium]